MARAKGFNRDAVKRFYDNLETLMERHNFHPINIYNLDDTGVTTFQGKPYKVIAPKGRKQVGSVTSADRGQLVTVEICMSATGAFVPPMFVFPRVRMKDELMDGVPHGSISVCLPSGWMQKDLFTAWFQHFIRVSGASLDNRVLLVLDGHATHTKNLEIIDLARAHGVSILNIPPLTSHKL